MRFNVKDHSKKVAFPDDVAEVIGYGGNDDDTDEENEPDESCCDHGSQDDEFLPPDSEEERTLSNLTRANTNFNTVTANLSDDTDSEMTVKTPSTQQSAASAGKTFASLMLGRAQKVSVTIL